MDSFVTFICPISNESQFRALANEFEAFHGIPQVIVVINGLHIPIFAPIIGGEDYYCGKEIIEFLLQGIIDTKCVFWDCEFGQA